MAIKHISSAITAGKETEKLVKVTAPPTTLAKSYAAKLELLEQDLGPLKLVSMWFGTDVVFSRGGLEHIGEDSTVVKLFRAVYLSGTSLKVTLEWKQGVSSMGTAWWVTVGTLPRVMFPGAKWKALKDRLHGVKTVKLGKDTTNKILEAIDRLGVVIIKPKKNTWLGVDTFEFRVPIGAASKIVKFFTELYGKPISPFEWKSSDMVFFGDTEGVYIFPLETTLVVRVVSSARALKRWISG